MLVGGSAYQLADDGIDISLGRIIGYANGAGSQSGAVATTFPTFESARTNGILKSESYGADNPTNFIAVGMNPFYVAQFDFNLNWDVNNWLDPAARKTVKLDIHTRNSSSADNGRNAIVLDRLVTN